MSAIGTKRTCRHVRYLSAFRGKADIGDDARNLVAPQCALIRIEAGWPGNLNRFPVSVILAPSTFRMERSWPRKLRTNRYFPSGVNAAPSGTPPNSISPTLVTVL